MSSSGQDAALSMLRREFNSPHPRHLLLSYVLVVQRTAFEILNLAT